MTVCSRRSSSQTWFYDFKKEGLSRIKFNISLCNNILTLGSTTDLLSEHLRTEDLWELLFADDLAIMADCWDGKSFWKDTDWMLMTTRGYQVALPVQVIASYELNPWKIIMNSAATEIWITEILMGGGSVPKERKEIEWVTELEITWTLVFFWQTKMSQNFKLP